MKLPIRYSMLFSINLDRQNKIWQNKIASVFYSFTIVKENACISSAVMQGKSINCQVTGS